MSLSLKSILFPKEWEIKSNSLNFIDVCYEEAKQMGVFKGEIKEYTKIYHTCSCAAYFWPDYNMNEMRIAGHLIIWFFLFDDTLDTNELNNNDAIKMLNRNEYIFIEGKLPDNPTPLENYTYFVRNEALNYVEDRIEMFSLFINKTIEWTQSIFPLTKTIELKEALDFETYSYLRKLNSGLDFAQAITFILNNRNNYKILSSLNNPRYSKMRDLSCYIVAYVNDIVSYCKEVKSGCGNSYSLIAFQIKGLTLNDAFKLLVNKINKCIEEFLYHEKMLISDIKNNNNNNENEYNLQINDINIYISNLKNTMIGNYLWSINSSRYASKSSPFIELRDSVSEYINNEIDRVE